MKHVAVAVSSLALALAGALSAHAGAPDWSKVPAKKVPIFFPGQASYEWAMSKSDHSAANQVIEKGRTCAYCHDEDATDIGTKIVAGKPVGNEKKPLEPNPIAGKPGFIPVTVQAAHDGEKLYLRFEWDATKPAGGKKMDPKNEVKLTVMMDNGSVEGARQNGCWATCHADMRTMPDASDAAKSHPKAKALGWDEGVTKYLRESRTGLNLTGKGRGGWDKLRPDAEIDAALKAGKFMDLIQFASGKGEKPADGYVLESRHMSGGKSLTKAEGKQVGGKWVVSFERTLAANGVGKHKVEPGKLYNVGFAIHDDHADARYHQVSLGYSMGLDNPKADFNAVKQ